MNITVDTSIQHYRLSTTAFVKTGPLNVHFVSVLTGFYYTTQVSLLKL